MVRGKRNRKTKCHIKHKPYGSYSFKGKTYFIYHNGALAGGNGYRRVANITELKFNEDGSIDEVPETTAGIAGSTTKIYTKAGAGVLAHENFLNSFDDADYPYENVYVGAMGYSDVKDAQWVLTDGKSDQDKTCICVNPV